ncbi:hypothetical protein CAEBREN_04574 [Caenorhabditis brenneri]|uniref:Coiled-coil domain-containing protein 93 n=1 Tax=Caenorhabditis brenneri TaxID=135651 RepID=G0MAG9_CAEBE|nr:hypothetical protein CAEBREN_04574 [Caenorhabditis brenneri]
MSKKKPQKPKQAAPSASKPTPASRPGPASRLMQAAKQSHASRLQKCATGQLRTPADIAASLAAAAKYGKAMLERMKFLEDQEFPEITIDDVIKQLGMIGYHRARVMQLSNYDKIVGGVACLVDVFRPLSPFENWIFEEDDVHGTKKAVADKRKEVEQVIGALTKVGCPYSSSVNDFLNCNQAVMSQIVSWVLPKVSRAALEKSRYECFLSTFNNPYDDLQSFTRDFVKGLRRFNETQHFELRRMDLFDTSIIRDKEANGKMILTEYNFYARNACRKYPSWSPKYEGGEDYLPGGYHVHQEVFREARECLDDMGSKLFEKLKNTSKIVATQLYTLIEDLEMAEGIAKIEARFIEEAVKYYEMFREYNTLNEIYRSSLQFIDNLKKPDLDEMNEHCQRLIAKGFLTEDAFYRKVDQARSTEQSLLSPFDENGDRRKYCFVRREEAKWWNYEHRKWDWRIMECIGLRSQLARAYTDYQAFIAERDSTEPSSDDEAEELRSVRITKTMDANISDDITLIMTKINHGIAEVELMLSPVEKADMDLRRAYIAYATDSSQLLADLYWKAKFMYIERRQLCDQMDKLKSDIKKARHRVHYARVEVHKLSRLNMAIRHFETQFFVFENDEECVQARIEAETCGKVLIECECISSASSDMDESDDTIAASSLCFTIEAEDFLETTSQTSSSGSAKENIPATRPTKKNNKKNKSNKKNNKKK